MPIHWLIDSRSHRVVITAEGRVTRAEFEEYLEVVAGAGANAYAKIFDGRGARTPSPQRTWRSSPRGSGSCMPSRTAPLRSSCQRPSARGFEPVLGALAAADRPLRLFTTLRAARAWLHGQATGRCTA